MGLGVLKAQAWIRRRVRASALSRVSAGSSKNSQLAVAHLAIDVPARQHVEAHRIGVALPRETGHALAAQLPDPILAVGQLQLDGVGIAVDLAQHLALAGLEAEDLAPLDHIAMGQRQRAIVHGRVEAEDRVHGQVLGHVRMQPGHVGRAALRARAPAVVHGRHAVDRDLFAAQHHLAFEVPALVEVAVVGRAPGELAGRTGGGHHRILLRIVDVEGRHDRAVGHIDLQLIGIVEADVPGHVGLQRLHPQAVGQAVVEQVAVGRHRDRGLPVHVVRFPRRHREAAAHADRGIDRA
ncbi:hypothetical protein [Pseudoxanthomonas winnipegensis]|uniref:hypothetical protein n=1 Tax=uncultured Pseudoxanthomonas sp. TaxID=281701 RepID=UPI0013EF107D|nr:hypothetical protein [Pseudoxanthomonas winnipegensis]